jgi:hypothetical protein
MYNRLSPRRMSELQRIDRSSLRCSVFVYCPKRLGCVAQPRDSHEKLLTDDDQNNKSRKQNQRVVRKGLHSIVTFRFFVPNSQSFRELLTDIGCPTSGVA